MDENSLADAPANTVARQLILQKYIIALENLRNIAENSLQVRPFYFDNYMQWQYFQQRSSIKASMANMDMRNYQTTAPPLAFLKMELLKQILDRRRQILYWTFYLFLLSLCVFAYRHRNDSLSTDASGSPSSQSFVYPSMRMWRRITLPIIQRFPSLTELYDEACLMQNPFFQSVDALNCDPCANVQSVVDLTREPEEPKDGYTVSYNGHTRVSENSESEMLNSYAPFVYKINQDPIQLKDFYNIYVNNHATFIRDAYRVRSTNHDVTNLEELFIKFNYTKKRSMSTPEAHNMWRCNRMLPARLLRKLFASPNLRQPRAGVALERYMAIDTAQAPAYTLPETECSNVYVQQALGTRYIFLRPTSECRHSCRTLSLRLTQSLVLSYNWLYWKPISTPDPVSESFSITLIGSYC